MILFGTGFVGIYHFLLISQMLFFFSCCSTDTVIPVNSLIATKHKEGICMFIPTLSHKMALLSVSRIQLVVVTIMACRKMSPKQTIDFYFMKNKEPKQNNQATFYTVLIMCNFLQKQHTSGVCLERRSVFVITETLVFLTAV